MVTGYCVMGYKGGVGMTGPMERALKHIDNATWVTPCISWNDRPDGEGIETAKELIGRVNHFLLE